jgi:ABC-type multidrug transport system ATPase subunit
MYPLVAAFLHRKAYQLSYGQRRKIELFRATLLAPPLLCLDEPFNFLDPHSRIEIAYLLRDAILPHTRIVMTTHLDDDIRLLAPRQFAFDDRQPARLQEV